ncbi:RelB/DinJ family protein addiction moduleantitoxin [Weissella oryzae SG25]|uniref:RelB/DinJ family protein addiction moduleantitoxin n=1 Tax=Weissella oryzae (strain DSM 25784 / JCM 18191 / LMG 30913 / SG25) TaxID=1329250 RepID=A0A069CSU5_WEIOS|nr:type II toxin-antitoxin system RelB/DinJ family antitoxin [Weissella oryzae]GAK30880.1 RelB/DinJ family protein addiction moduleantitoxin [Weissella oryzae SG25]
MAEKLIQLRVESEIKTKSDEIFAKQGLTTQNAIKIFLTQVVNNNNGPFAELFTR